MPYNVCSLVNLLYFRAMGHVMNENLMTKAELEKYRLKRTIEAFKKYDAERREYVQKLERKLQDLEYLYEDYKAMYEELLEDGGSPLGKMIEKCNKYKQALKSYESHMQACSFVRKYMDEEGRMAPWFVEIMEDAKDISRVISYRNKISDLKTQNKKLKESLNQAINELVKERRKNQETSSTASCELPEE